MKEEKDTLEFGRVMLVSGLGVLVIIVLLIIASTVVG